MRLWRQWTLPDFLHILLAKDLALVCLEAGLLTGFAGALAILRDYAWPDEWAAQRTLINPLLYLACADMDGRPSCPAVAYGS